MFHNGNSFSFNTERRRKPSEGNNNPQGPSGPVASNAQPTPHPNHPTLQYNQKTTSLVKRHSYTIKRPTPYSKLCNRSKRQNNTDGTAVESVDTHSGFRNEHQNDFSEMTKLNRDSEKLLNEPTKDSEQMVNMNYVGVGLISSGVNDIPQPDVNIGSTNDGTGPTNAIKDSKTIVAGENNPNLSSDNSFTTVKVKREDGISEGFDDVGNACLGISAVTANNSLVTADYSLGTADYSLMTADANPRFEDNKSTLEETASELTNQEALELTGEEPGNV